MHDRIVTAPTRARQRAMRRLAQLDQQLADNKRLIDELQRLRGELVKQAKRLECAGLDNAEPLAQEKLLRGEEAALWDERDRILNAMDGE